MADARSRPSEPAVSVVLTTHRRADMVAGAVESVLAQTFRDFELLVIDDSGRGTPEQLATEAALAGQRGDARLRYLPQDTPHGGAGARNVGIAAARAPWVAFLDDDDRWLPEKLARQLEALERAPASTALVYTGFVAVDGAGRTLYTSRPRPESSPFPALLARNVIGTTSSVMCRRDALVELGGFDASLPAAQDRDLYLRLCRSHPSVAVPAPLVRFVQHAGVRITADKGNKLAAARRLLEKYADDYADRPRLRSRALTSVGRYAWLVGEAREARRQLRAAMALDALNLEAWRLWLASWVEPGLVKRLRNGRRAGATRTSGAPGTPGAATREREGGR